MPVVEPTNSKTNTEEIDLRELFNILGNAFNRLGIYFLLIFLFFKKNFYKLLGLIVIGIVLGYTLNQLITSKYKVDVIVKPNFNSKEYLYDVVDEIQSKLATRDSVFFKELGIQTNLLKNFSITIAPIENAEKDVDNSKKDTEYLKVLQDYKENDFVLDAVRLEILNKIVFTHRITFSFKNLEKGEEYSKILMNYINSNPYYSELQKVYVDNSKSRIENNNKLIAQVDTLVKKYAQQLGYSGSSIDKRDTPIYFDAEKPLDAPGLLSLKNKLIEEIEYNQVKLAELENPISIIHFGKSRKVDKRFFSNAITLAPLILIVIYFLWLFFKYLDNKSRSLEE